MSEHNNYAQTPQGRLAYKLASESRCDEEYRHWPKNKMTAGEKLTVAGLALMVPVLAVAGGLLGWILVELVF